MSQPETPIIERWHLPHEAAWSTYARAYDRAFMLGTQATIAQRQASGHRAGVDALAAEGITIDLSAPAPEETE